jgi:uncharacterized protein (DUF488 family)
MSRAGDNVFTIGHSTRTLDEFTEILRRLGITLVVDVRAFPRSRTAPQFNLDSLPGVLAREGVAYRHLPALGGRRHRGKGETPSVNEYWRVPGFRNYADHAQTEEFRTGLASLLTLARDDRCVVMCAEAVWWRCHRRIIADYLLAGGTPVTHVMGPGRIVPATLTPGAILMADGTLRYPVTVPPTLPDVGASVVPPLL